MCFRGFSTKVCPQCCTEFQRVQLSRHVKARLLCGGRRAGQLLNSRDCHNFRKNKIKVCKKIKKKISTPDKEVLLFNRLNLNI